MASILSGFQEFLRRFSRKLFLLFNRQEIFLVDEDKFIQLFEENLRKNPDICCCYCERRLDKENVKGYFLDDEKAVHFFCTDLNCNKKYPKEG